MTDPAYVKRMLDQQQDLLNNAHDVLDDIQSIVTGLRVELNTDSNAKSVLAGACEIEHTLTAMLKRGFVNDVARRQLRQFVPPAGHP